MGNDLVFRFKLEGFYAKSTCLRWPKTFTSFMVLGELMEDMHPFLTKELNPEFLEQSQRYLMQVARHGMPSFSRRFWWSDQSLKKDGVTWTYLLSIVFLYNIYVYIYLQLRLCLINIHIYIYLHSNQFWCAPQKKHEHDMSNPETII